MIEGEGGGYFRESRKRVGGGIFQELDGNSGNGKVRVDWHGCKIKIWKGSPRGWGGVECYLKSYLMLSFF